MKRKQIIKIVSNDEIRKEMLDIFAKRVIQNEMQTIRK